MKDSGVPPDQNKIALVALLITLASVAAWIGVVVLFIF